MSNAQQTPTCAWIASASTAAAPCHKHMGYYAAAERTRQSRTRILLFIFFRCADPPLRLEPTSVGTIDCGLQCNTRFSLSLMPAHTHVRIHAPMGKRVSASLRDPCVPRKALLAAHTCLGFLKPSTRRHDSINDHIARHTPLAIIVVVIANQRTRDRTRSLHLSQPTIRRRQPEDLAGPLDARATNE